MGGTHRQRSGKLVVGRLWPATDQRRKSTVTPAEYKSARQDRGTQKGVAALLGVNYTTIQRREDGDIEITQEAEIALLSLRKKNRNR